MASVSVCRSWHTDGLVQNSSISIANALEILQSCTKPSIKYVPQNMPRCSPSLALLVVAILSVLVDTCNICLTIFKVASLALGQPRQSANHVNSVWPSEAIWRYDTLSTLVMACCLIAPHHYRNQCWLIINKIQWHSPEGSLTGKALDIHPYIWAAKLQNLDIDAQFVRYTALVSAIHQWYM